MKETYYPPTYGEKQFHCINCHVFASQSWCNTTRVLAGFAVSQPVHEMKISVCSHCQTETFWFNGKMVVPDESPIEQPHSDLPEDCLIEYKEARSVFSRSPRAAAALLRLSIQKLMPHLGEKGANINDDIKSLVAKGLPPLIQKALDYCRVIGNNAVHPGEIILNDTPDIAQNLFKMINIIVEDRITRPKEIEELYNQLPQSSLDAIEKRDKSSASSQS